MSQLQYIQYDPIKDGVTQSLLTTWRNCPTLARQHLRGLYRPGFGEALMYGTMFHAYKDVILNLTKQEKIKQPRDIIDLGDFIERKVAQKLEKEKQEAPQDAKQKIDDLEQIINVVVLKYFEFWKEDFYGSSKKVWEDIEYKFKVPFGSLRIPLKGRVDGKFRLNGKKWLLENKTKSRIPEENLVMVIGRDLQVLLYSLAEQISTGELPVGVLYNIVRKPQLRQKAKESTLDFCKRIYEDIGERPEFYFMRFEIPITGHKIAEFSLKLENELIRFYDWWRGDIDPQYTHNCINQYGACPMLSLCDSDFKDYGGLYVRDHLFRELENDS